MFSFLVFMALTWAESEPSPQLKISSLQLMQALLATNERQAVTISTNESQSYSSSNQRDSLSTSSNENESCAITNESQAFMTTSNQMRTQSSIESWRTLFQGLLPGILREAVK